mmetsp:Transcript_15453/g.35628  ORF Transcript_15453/g.35628 Transcript_15453/m.35628 type:complete len:214 (-) Transcript_15453:227-868(-)
MAAARRAAPCTARSPRPRACASAHEARECAPRSAWAPSKREGAGRGNTSRAKTTTGSLAAAQLPPFMPRGPRRLKTVQRRATLPAYSMRRQPPPSEDPSTKNESMCVRVRAPSAVYGAGVACTFKSRPRRVPTWSWGRHKCRTEPARHMRSIINFLPCLEHCNSPARGVNISRTCRACAEDRDKSLSTYLPNWLRASDCTVSQHAKSSSAISE